MGSHTEPTKAYAMRELRRFFHAIGLDHSSRKDREKLAALVKEMQQTARKRGLSEYEMGTMYDADALLALYRETFAGTRH